MGTTIGRHLLTAETRLAVYDHVLEERRELVDAGATDCADAAEVARRADVVLVVVVDDEQVQDVVAACFEGARSGTVIAVSASVRPDTCRKLAQEGAQRGVHVIDAALVRGERGAEEGRLVLFCGGDVQAIERLQSISAPFAEVVLRVGGVGAGQAAKTANNILLWACIRADVEALRLGRALGVETRALREALALGSGANRPLAEWGKHRLRWPHKDLEVALAIAAEAGVDVPLVAALPALMEELTVADLRELS